MEDYKVHSSWTFHEICHRCMDPCRCLNHRGLSKGSDFVMLHTNGKISKYSVEGELLQHFLYIRLHIRHSYLKYTLYTESLATLPCDRDKKKRAKTRSRWRGFCRRIFSRKRSNNQRE
ncbi:hypothetical protein PIB30_001464 [Stylosanthes scabra]|uniref:Uncharacterized protein n=1 Tax=Stylosanthes scabra TaxID=79078 RepID=A0ABU6Q2H3_9FABA|nr:hypothetical protein [Stylosanthes scabra]